MKRWHLAVLLGAAVFVFAKKAKASSGAPQLGQGFESLNQLAGELARLDSRFDPRTRDGRAALALALAIGGTEVYSKGTTATDFFTRRGGTGNNMLGFAQYNLKYHAEHVDTPEKYATYLADMLTGKAPLPNGRYKKNHAANLRLAVAAGQVPSDGLSVWMRANNFGGSNWQGIDDGWHRVPGLSEQLVHYIYLGVVDPTLV